MKRTLCLLALALVAAPARAATDSFGVSQVYPTVAGGKEWFANFGPPARTATWGPDSVDPWLNWKGDATYAIDGAGTLAVTGSTPRVYIFDPAQARQWHSVEMTVYAKRVADDGTAYAGIVGVARTNHTADTTNLCDTRGYGARARYDGTTDFDKETSHPNAYAVASKPQFAGGLPYNQWIGYKHIVYDLPNGHVVNELWLDMTDGANGGTWTKVNSFEDTGANMGAGGVACAAGIDPAMVLSASESRAGSETGKPNLVAYWRSTNVGANGLLYKKMSVREIDASALWSQSQAVAGALYVSPSGSDANAGTLSAPFKTVAKGLAALRSGGTLYLRAGTYAESFWDQVPSGASWSAPTTVAAYPGETVTLQPPAGAMRVWTFTNAHFVVLDHLILDARNATYEAVKITYSGANTGDHIRIQDSEIRNSPAQGVYADQTSPANEFLRDKIHDNGVSDFDHGLYLDGSNNLVDHCEIYRNSGWGVHVYNGYAGGHADNNVVRGNLIHDNARLGTRGAGIILSSGDSNLAYDNVIWNNNGGIQVDYGATRTKILSNTIYKNNGSTEQWGVYLGNSPPDGGGGSAASGAVVKNNILFGNNGGAVINNQAGTAVSNNITADPLFTNAAGLDFSLQAGSPALDAGADLSGYGVATDIAGTARPQGAAYDAGAYERVSGAPAPPPPSPAPAPAPTPLNLALNKLLTASASLGLGASPDLANDGDATTAWAAPSGASQWLMADLGLLDQVTGVALRWAGAYAATYEVDTSTDALAWSRAYATTTGQGGLETVSFATATARYVRVLAAARSGQDRVAVAELAAYGATPPGADTTPPAISGLSAIVTAGGQNTLQVAWRTDKPADTRLDWGGTPFYGSSAPTDPGLSLTHSATLGPIAAGALAAGTIHYRVGSRDASGNLARSGDLQITLGASGAGGDDARAPQRFLTPATADGINDAAVFGPMASEVTILDLRGRVVFRQAGAPIVWNGRDASGRVVESGVYVAKIKRADGGRATQAFAVAR